MKLKIFLFVILISQVLYGQLDEYYETDSVEIPPGYTTLNKNNSVMQIQQSTGHFNALVLLVGFPDRSTAWPIIENFTDANYPNNVYPNEFWPKLGAYPDGTMLRDEIDANGPVVAVDWYEDVIESYFNNESSGNCTVDIRIPQMNDETMPVTTKNFSEWITSNSNNPNTENVVWLQFDEMIGEALSNLIAEQPNTLDGINMICAVFQGVSKPEYQVTHTSGPDIHNTGRAYPWGQTITDPITGTPLFSATDGTLNHQRVFKVLPHEILHVFGGALDPTGTFVGLPDRGNDVAQFHPIIPPNISVPAHYNLTWGYDMMYHNGQYPALTSLYGQPPLSIYDKIVLGWIDGSEILEIRNTDELNIKLYDVNDQLNSNELLDGCRVVKLFIAENYSGTDDEYFLIEYRDGSGFDRNFYNAYENEIFTGITIWHIKEDGELNVLNDQLIDLELAVPYNGWNGRTPIPDDGYYTSTYNRGTDFNGNRSQEFDYLDDLHEASTFRNDGGGQFLEGRIHPLNPVQFIERTMPLKSNFYSDDVLQGKKSDKFTAITYPSTSNWIGENTYISVTDIKRENGYMSLNVRFNYLEGELEKDVTLSGNITVGGDLTIPAGKTLTISEGTELIFENNSRLKIYGTLNVNGISSNKVTFDFIEDDYPTNGIRFYQGSGGTVNNAIIKNATYGIYVYKSSPTIKNCIIHDCEYGIRSYYNSPNIETNEIYNTYYGMYFYKGTPTITDNYIHNTTNYGILVNSVYTETYIRKNTLDNCSGGVWAYGSNTVKLRGGNGASYGKNIIQNYGSSRHAVYITGGTPDLGEAHPSSHKGYNNIYRVSGTYVVKNTTGNEVMAERNYWGGSSPTSSWFSGNIDWGEYLTSPYSSAGSSLDKASGIEPDKQMLYDANEFADSKSYLNASDKYKQLILDYPESRYGGTALAWSMATYQLTKDLESQRDYLQKHTTHKNERVRNSAMLWLQTLEAEVGNKEAADKVVNSTSIKEAVGVEIRLNWANDLLNMYNDEKGTETIFDKLVKAGASESTLLTIESIKATALDIEEMEIPEKSENFNNNMVETVVKETKLSTSYPNPFNPTTTIGYQLQQKANVSLIVYNSIGQEVAVLVNQQKEGGIHNVDFNASNLPSGLYIYRLQVQTADGKDSYVEARKMILLK